MTPSAIAPSESTRVPSEIASPISRNTNAVSMNATNSQV